MEVNVNGGNFEEEVLRSDVPVLVDFWAEWCGPCMMLGPVVAEVAKEKEGALKVCKVNVDESPDLAAKFGIMSIPALLLFKGGELAAQKIGYMGKDEVLVMPVVPLLLKVSSGEKEVVFTSCVLKKEMGKKGMSASEVTCSFWMLRCWQ